MADLREAGEACAAAEATAEAEAAERDVAVTAAVQAELLIRAAQA